MKLVYVYDGVKTQSKDRRKLLVTRYLTGDITPEELWQEVAEYTYEAYNYDKIENIYSRGWSKVDKNRTTIPTEK